MTKYQLWICKTNTWMMIGFFDTTNEAYVKLDQITDSAITEFFIIEVKAYTP